MTLSAKQIIDAVGGRKAVRALTGLTRGRIHQWEAEDHIPAAWMKFIEAKFPSELQRAEICSEKGDRHAN